MLPDELRSTFGIAGFGKYLRFLRGKEFLLIFDSVFVIPEQKSLDLFAFILRTDNISYLLIMYSQITEQHELQ